ncbi:hypothetical protein E4U13_007320, partial [Claviceps humidiphila]
HPNIITTHCPPVTSPPPTTPYTKISTSSSATLKWLLTTTISLSLSPNPFIQNSPPLTSALRPLPTTPHSPLDFNAYDPGRGPCHEHPNNDIAAKKARIIEDPQGVDAAMAIITLRRDSDDHPQQHSHITTPPQSPERAKQTSDWVEKHSLPELVPGNRRRRCMSLGRLRRLSLGRMNLRRMGLRRIEMETSRVGKSTAEKGKCMF